MSWGTHSQHSCAPGVGGSVCVPFLSCTGSAGVSSELFSSEPGEERDKHSLFQTLPTFPELLLPLHWILTRSCSSWFQFLCSPKCGTIHNLSWQSFHVTCPKGTQVLQGNFVHKSALVWVFFCWFSLRI